MMKRSRLGVLLDHDERSTSLHGHVPAQGFPTVVRKGGVRAGTERDQTGTKNGEHRGAKRSFPNKDRRREEKASYQLALKGNREDPSRIRQVEECISSDEGHL